jgi:mono/diheme cytochrome c family protein
LNAIRASVCLSLLIGVAPGCVATGDSGEAAPPGATPRTAIEVYRQERCGTCHALREAETAGIFAPPHDSMRIVAERRIAEETYAGDARNAEAYILESIISPGVYRVAGFERTRFPMPAYSHLGADQLDALVHLLMQQPAHRGGQR